LSSCPRCRADARPDARSSEARPDERASVPCTGGGAPAVVSCTRGRETGCARRKMRPMQVRMHVHLLAQRGILGDALMACVRPVTPWDRKFFSPVTQPRFGHWKEQNMTQPYNGMPALELTDVTWRKSKHSNPNGACVEVAHLPNGEIAVRNSRFPS